jgi:site-specific recombinase XerD
MARFLEYSREHNATNTTKRYEASSRLLVAALGAKKLNAVTPDDVERYKNARLAGGGRARGRRGKGRETGKSVQPSTVNGDLACLSAMYTYFIDLKITNENPVSSVKSLPLDNGRMRVITFEEEGLISPPVRGHFATSRR